MRTLITLLFISLLLLLLVSTTHAQWVEIQPPDSSGIDCIAGNNSGLFAGTDSGLYFSNDYGANWTAINDGFIKHVYKLAVSESNIYVAVDTGLFLSTNLGTEWSQIYGWRPCNTLTAADKYVFAGGEASNRGDMEPTTGWIISSDSFGTNWKSTGLDYEINALLIFDTLIIAGNSGYQGPVAIDGPRSDQVNTDGYIYISTDYGNTWASVAGPTSPTECLIANSANIFAGTWYAGVFRSSNNGIDWIQSNNGLTGYDINCFATSDNAVFTGNGSGVFLTTDDAAQWQSVNSSLSDLNVTELTVAGSALFAITNNGSFKLWKRPLSEMIPQTTGWVQTSLDSVYINNFAVSGQNLFAGTDEGLFLSTDNGTTWMPRSPMTAERSALTISGANIFAGNDGGVFLSSDNGSNWNHIGVMSNVTSLAVSDSMLFAGTWEDGGVHIGLFGILVRSSNKGAHWDTVGGLGAISNLHVSKSVQGNNLFAVYSYAVPFVSHWGVSRSTDNGLTWKEASDGLYPPPNETNNVLCLGSMDTMMFAGTFNRGAYLSTNQGTNWMSADSGITDSVINCFAVGGTNIYAGANHGVFLTTDNGTYWIDISYGLSNSNITTLAVSDSFVFAGTSNGVWKRSLMEINLSKFITATSGVHGRIEPSGTFSVSYGGSQRFTFIPDNEIYLVDTVFVDGVAVDSTEGYTFTGVTAPHSIHVVFKLANTLSHHLHAGWNLLSLPLHANNHFTAVNYPGAGPTAYEYAGSYQQLDSLEVGRGYWLKVGSNNSYSLHGELVFTETVQVSQRWNMIGSLSIPIPVSSITSEPPGMVTGSFWGYDGTQYVASDTIYPGKGYWVRVNENGTLILSTTPSASKTIKIVASGEKPPSPPDNGLSNQTLLPKEYGLDQAFPNPFNPSTTIKYQLPVDSRVSLKVYNMLGQVVSVLADEQQPAGFRSFDWNAGSFASGVYFYRIEAIDISNPAKSFTQVKKVLLLR